MPRVPSDEMSGPFYSNYYNYRLVRQWGRDSKMSGPDAFSRAEATIQAIDP